MESMKPNEIKPRWKVTSRDTPFGIRWDVATPIEVRGKTLYLVSALCGDDNFKSRRDSIRHAVEKYGEAR